MNSNNTNKTETNKIPCAVIRDLFPSYIDGLTSEETGKEIEDHIAGCEPCGNILEKMREPDGDAGELSGEDRAELDFLKKTRKKGIGIVLAGIAGAIALVAAVLFIRFYMIGSDSDAYWVAAKVNVSGCDVTVDGSVADSIHGISKVIFEESDGTVYVKTKSVIASPLHWSDFHESYTARGEVRQVVVNGRVCWYNGVDISTRAGRVYAARHEYMGSMTDNMKTAEALDMPQTLGGFTNELVTSAQPYRWRIILSEEQKPITRTVMEAYGYILIAAIRNLDEVEFEFTPEGASQTQNLIITKEQADGFFGQDIKKCYDSPLLLDELIDRTRLDSVPMMLILSERDNAENAEKTGNGTISLKIMNKCDDPVSSVTVCCLSDEDIVSSQSGQNADNSFIDYGQSLYFELLPEDFGGSGKERSVLIYVETDNGRSYFVGNPIKAPSNNGASAVMTIAGSEKDGFIISEYGYIEDD